MGEIWLRISAVERKMDKLERRFLALLEQNEVIKQEIGEGYEQ